MLDEIGISLNAQLSDAPSQMATTASTGKVAVKESEDMDLQARLDNLKKG